MRTARERERRRLADEGKEGRKEETERRLAEGGKEGREEGRRKEAGSSHTTDRHKDHKQQWDAGQILSTAGRRGRGRGMGQGHTDRQRGDRG